ncbi:MAG: hypothetical protein OXB91_13055, partial [Bryobacterales bacterium]|nr:hypothetical protein [Bryobacterales bacterium]
MCWRALLVIATVTAAQAQTKPCEGPSELASAAARGDAEAQAALGYWFAENGRTECAVTAFNASVLLDPSSVAARYNLGVALIDSGE